MEMQSLFCFAGTDGQVDIPQNEGFTAGIPERNIAEFNDMFSLLCFLCTLLHSRRIVQKPQKLCSIITLFRNFLHPSG